MVNNFCKAVAKIWAKVMEFYLRAGLPMGATPIFPLNLGTKTITASKEAKK